jgi:hypothetical protein
MQAVIHLEELEDSSELARLLRVRKRNRGDE